MDRNGVTKHVFSTGDEHIGNVYHIMEDDKGNFGSLPKATDW